MFSVIKILAVGATLCFSSITLAADWSCSAACGGIAEFSGIKHMHAYVQKPLVFVFGVGSNLESAYKQALKKCEELLLEENVKVPAVLVHYAGMTVDIPTSTDWFVSATTPANPVDICKVSMQIFLRFK